MTIPNQQPHHETPLPPHFHLPESDHHRDVTGGALRAGVFGAMDGLVSNFALIAGVVGGGATGSAVILTGLAGLSAGAFSMAVGEYTSVIAQTEATQAEIAMEKEELKNNPYGEMAELAQVYEGYGVRPELARQVAEDITLNPEHNWRVHAREELGIDPDDLPSPLVAAGSSFCCFAVGALLPLLTFLLGFDSLLSASVVSGLGLLALGALISRITLRSPLFGALRQLIFGAAAAAATFGIGSLVGVGLS